MLPKFKNKFSSPSITDPKTFIECKIQSGRKTSFLPPKGVILYYQSRQFESILKNHKTVPGDGFLAKMQFLEEGNIGLFEVGVGGPATAIALEKLIAFGVKKFIAIGTAGSLQPHIPMGSFVICNKALRDEGTSHHYLPPADFIEADAKNINKLAHIMQRIGVPYAMGASWSTDALFRETIDEVQYYQSQGIITVDLESAALLSVAQHRDISMAVLFTISDILSAGTWEPHFYHPQTVEGLETLYQIARTYFE